MQSVLMIDDEPLILDSSRMFLEQYGGMQVRTVPCAKDALALMTDIRFDVLVVDYDLPDIDGIEFLKIIRSRGDFTPVILFTGVGREHAAIEALNNGANFFLKKGDNPGSALKELVRMIRLVGERRIVNGLPGTTLKLFEETISFFSEPAYAIDPEAKVIAWNEAMAELTGIAAKDILGRGDGAHALPFFGKNVPMLTELIFSKDEAIRDRNFTIIERNGATICAWTRVRRDDGPDRILWMKAAALHDKNGAFIASIGSVRDVSTTLGPELVRQANAVPAKEQIAPASSPVQEPASGRDMDKAESNYLEGLRLSYRRRNYREAILYFDKAIEIDPSHAAAWHDRAVCFRYQERDMHALKSYVKAVELSPDDEEFLFSLGSMLQRIGILQNDRSYIEAAVKTLSRVVELNPYHAEAWNILGSCMKEMGKDEAAKKFFEQAAQLTRQNKAKKNVRNLDELV